MLKASAHSRAVELFGLGDDMKVPVGLLDVDFFLLPKLETRLRLDDITERWKKEKHQETEATRLFFAYAKQWWQDYIDVLIHHSTFF